MSLAQDFRCSLRNWMSRPALTAVALLSLVLGIGANTAVFSLISALLLEPLPYGESDRLVRIWETFAYPGGRGRGTVSVANLLDWREQNDVFENIGAYSGSNSNLLAEGSPLRIQSIRVTRDVFDSLHVDPLLGRTFNSEDSPEEGKSVVLSYGLWNRVYGADPAIVGQNIRIDGEDHFVLGVMPKNFTFPPRSTAEIWLPLEFTEQQKANRGNHFLGVIARMGPGVELAQAESALRVIARRLEEQYPQNQAERSVDIAGLDNVVRGDSGLTLAALWGASLLVLLIACANVANLLLARTSARQREFAIRAALGADRKRLLRQVLIESGTLSLVGGTLALAAGFFAIRWLSALPGSTIPANSTVGIDSRVLLFSLVAAVAATLLCGLIPALRVSGNSFQLALRDRQAAAGRKDRWRSGLVIAEMALSLVVLIGAGLMLKSFVLLTRVDPGLVAAQRLTFRVSLPGNKYQERAQVVTFYDRLLEEVRHLPGVLSAGMTSLLPTQNWGNNGNFRIEGQAVTSPRDEPFSEIRVVSPGFFEALQIPLMRGRLIDQTDRADSRKVVLINETLARRHWGDRDPIGTRLAWANPPREEDWWTVVGIVGDVRSAGLDREFLPEMYFPYGQNVRDSMSLVIHSSTPELSLVPSLQTILKNLDPDQPIYLVRTMSEVVQDSFAVRRFRTLLYSLFAGLALVMSMAGIYGVLAYLVAQRRQEIGIRMALGADSRAIMGLVGREAMLLTSVGAVFGLLGAWGLTRFIASQLHQISATDPLVFTGLTVLLLLVGLAAAIFPARRASQVDPLIALRQEGG